MRQRIVFFVLLIAALGLAAYVFFAMPPKAEDDATLGQVPAASDQAPPQTTETDTPPADVDALEAAAPPPPLLPPKEDEVRIHGTVVFDEDDRPVGGAIIRPARFPNAPWSIRTDAEGAFAFNLNRTLIQFFDAFACYTPGYATGVQEVDWRTLSDDTTTVALHFRLKEGASLRGRVVSRETHEGVSGVVIHVFAQEGGDGFQDQTTVTLMATTGPGGTYALDSLFPGIYEISADGSEIGYPATNRARTEVEVRDAREYTVPDLVVARGAMVSGTVTDDTGAPIADADLRIRPARGVTSTGWILTDVRSDEQGTYELPGMLFGVYYHLTVRAPGHVGAVLDDWLFTPEDVARPFDIVLQRGARVAGQVLYEDGVPAVGSTVGLPADDEALAKLEPEWNYEETDENGAFVLTGLAAGDHTFEVLGEDVIAAVSSPLSLTLKPGEEVTGVRLIIARGDAPEPSMEAEFRGIVIDAERQPIPRAQVTVLADDEYKFARQRVHTGEDGRFSLEVAEPEAVDLMVSSDRGNALAFDIPTDREATIIVREEVGIGGTVIGAGGAPVSGCAVYLMPDLRQIEEGARAFGGFVTRDRESDYDVTDAEGRFLFSPAKGGTYLIEARAPDYEVGRTAPFEVTDFESRRNLTVRISPGAVLGGTVTDSKGASVQGARVRVTRDREDADVLGLFRSHEEPYAPRRGITDAAGSYLIQGLAPGDYQVTAEHPDFAPADPVVVTVSQGQRVLDVRLALKAEGCIAGRVNVSKHRAAETVQVFHDGATHVLNIRPDGTFEKCQLDAGEYQVALQPIGRERRGMNSALFPFVLSQTVQVRNGETTHVDFGAVPAPSTVTGQVTAGQGRYFRVVLRSAADGEASIRIDANMDFGFYGVPPGSYTLEVFSTVNLRPDRPQTPLYEEVLHIGPGKDLALAVTLDGP